MRYAAVVVLLLAAGCSNPTAPTPVPPPIVNVPPVVTPPPPPPTRNPLTGDPQFNPAFYRMFALDALDGRGRLTPLRRQTQAPRIYLRTIHNNGRPIDPITLDQTAAALINTTGLLTGTFGVAGLEMGTGTRRGQQGWITVSWLDDPERRYCGYAGYASDWIELYTNTPGCRCPGGPVIRPRIIKHELGHSLGYYHTDSPADLMFDGGPACDMAPSAREIFHAKVAYSQPIGSLEP